MNLVILSGNVGNVFEINNGLKFSLATDDFNGKEKITLWTDVLLFGKQAETLKPYIEKGKKLLVLGRLKEDNDENGQPSKSIILARDVDLL